MGENKSVDLSSVCTCGKCHCKTCGNPMDKMTENKTIEESALMVKYVYNGHAYGKQYRQCVSILREAVEKGKLSIKIIDIPCLELKEKDDKITKLEQALAVAEEALIRVSSESSWRRDSLNASYALEKIKAIKDDANV